MVSSNVYSIRYDWEKRTLTVVFHNGGMYEYSDVPLDVAVGFLTADSPGRYLHHYIKDRFAFSKL